MQPAVARWASQEIIGTGRWSKSRSNGRKCHATRYLTARRGWAYNSDLHNGEAGAPTSVPALPLGGRPRFDGDMVSQDALPRTITLVNQMEKNITADTQLALAA